ncbi:MAG: HupE/UreJ family protein [Parvibaculales bacterium]
MRVFRFFLAALAVTVFVGVCLSPSLAHEVRPGFLKIDEIAPENYAVSWKQPVRGGAQNVAGLGLRPVFPASCERGTDSTMRLLPGVLVETFTLTCAGGLRGQAIGIEGLQKTITDVFVQLHEADDDPVHMRLTPEQPVQKFTGGVGLFNYLWLGVEHLVFGYDHILFVIGLVMLVSGWRRLVLVITGFTLAHSVTLGLSVLDVIYLPAAPVEAVIALSIVFVATELLRPEEARARLTQQHPQIIALAFGLLHGFGFAGVLADIGLPRETGFFALALFNIGLEIGQLCVVGLCLGFAYMARHAAMPPVYSARVQTGIVMAMGGLASYWLIARTVQIIGF